jgi:hypothetical protein
VGDEITLSVNLRNYTGHNVTMPVVAKQADWFTLLTPSTVPASVASDGSTPVVFGLRANSAVEAGRLRSHGASLRIAQLWHAAGGGGPASRCRSRSSLIGTASRQLNDLSLRAAARPHSLYIWSSLAEGSHFNFRFTPRYAIHAKAAPSTLSDYYNPDLKAVLPPETFSVTNQLKRNSVN